MTITNQFKKQQLDYLKSYLPQEISQNLEFYPAVLASIDGFIKLSSPNVCESRKMRLGLSCDSSVLAERTLTLANGNEFIAGARFKNLDIDYPFVEIQLGVEKSIDVIHELSEIVQYEFKNLHPKGLKFKDKPIIDRNLNQYLEKWSHTVFGKVNKQQNLDCLFDINFCFTQNLEWYSQYLAEYQDRLAEKKELSGFVLPNPLSDFEDAVSDQALMVVNDTKGFCGVVAGVSCPIYGLPSIYMIESYLSKRWVGKNFAQVAHSFFQNEMSKRLDYVWGTIYDQNLSSLKTAIRTGRQIIETEYFYRFDII